MKSIVDRKVGTKIAKMLGDVQHHHGYLTTADLEKIAERTGEPLNVIEDVVSFFPHYRLEPPPKCSVHICRDMSCRLRGSVQIAEKLKQWQSQQPAGAVEIHEASCLGRCDRAPAMMIGEKLFVARDEAESLSIAQSILRGESVQADSDMTTAVATLANATIDCYRDEAGPKNPYQAVRDYLDDPDPTRIIQALKTASLLGMGGAGAPAFGKWDEARQAVGQTKYVVCNADESEPGTFKDRDLLLAAPHLLIEGMVLAGLVIGATQGYIYIRHEYLEQVARLEQAIAEAVKLNACGNNIFGKGRSFQLEVFVSPGGYVCGEQTALIEALEGKRSEPRNRPPELQTNGLYDQPTLLNNVETFAWVPAIMLKPPTDEQMTAEKNEARKPDDVRPGGVWYKRSGRGRFPGKRFYSISGDVAKPGAYEVPCGITLGELIDDYCGGMRDGMALQAVALSGPSGGFLPAFIVKNPKNPRAGLRAPKVLDKDRKETDELKYPQLAGDSVDVRLLPLDKPASRELGFELGAAIVVYGRSADMLDQALACSRFYQRESCGKCVPCRLGSRKLVDIAERYGIGHQGRFPSDAEQTVNALVALMETTSICGLGQVAGNPLRSYLRYFADQTAKTT